MGDLIIRDKKTEAQTGNTLRPSPTAGHQQNLHSNPRLSDSRGSEVFNKCL